MDAHVLERAQVGRLSAEAKSKMLLPWMPMFMGFLRQA